jgi:hypothetical protein
VLPRIFVARRASAGEREILEMQGRQVPLDFVCVGSARGEGLARAGGQGGAERRQRHVPTLRVRLAVQAPEQPIVNGQHACMIDRSTILRMAGQASFDVTSKVDLQEVDNAVNQARKELAQRYDFKGSKAAIDFKRAENIIEILADDNFKMEAVWDILQTPDGPPRRAGQELEGRRRAPVAGGLVSRTIALQQGFRSKRRATS